MSTLSYVFLFFGTVLAMYVCTGTYFIVRQYKTFMQVQDPFTNLKMPQLGLIIAICFIFSSMALFLFTGNKEWFVENHFVSVGLIALAMGTVGLIPQETFLDRLWVAVLQFLGVCTVLYLQPEDSFLFTFTVFPYEVNLIIVGLLWTVFLYVLSALNRLEGFFIQQFFMLMIFGICVSAFYSHNFFANVTFFILLGTISLGALPFWVSGIFIGLTQPAKLFFNFLFSWIVFLLIVQGNFATASLLTAYPLTEIVIFVSRWFVQPLTNEKPLFLWENIAQQTNKSLLINLCIAKRNFIYTLASLLSLNSSSVKQAIVLSVIISVEMYSSFRDIAGGSAEKKTLKELFVQMKTDMRADYENSKKHILLIKEKIEKRRADKINDKK